MLSTERTILVLLPFLVRGAMALAIVREMRRRGLKVAIAVFDVAQAYTPDEALDLRDTDDLIDLSHVGRSRYLGILLDELARRNVGLVLQIGAPQAYRLLPYIREAAKHVQVVDTLYNEIGHTVNHFLYERSIHGVIVESQYMRGFVERNTLLDMPSVHVLESGIESARFSDAQPRQADDRLIIGYVGRMAPEKNPIGFVEMADALAGLRSSLFFLVFGEGELTSRVKDAIWASRDASRIKFVGYVEDVKIAFQQIDVLVVPSIVDGRPNIVMEANAAGVPVIAAPVGGLPEMIEEGKNGYVVSPKDVSRMDAILSELGQDRAKLLMLKEAARSLAAAQFDRVAMMDRYENLFQHYLSRSSQSMSPEVDADVSTPAHASA